MSGGLTILHTDTKQATSCSVGKTRGDKLNDEGPGAQVPRKRVGVKSKTTDTAAQIEPDEDVHTTREEKYHESRRQFHRQQSETATRTLASGEASG